MNIGYNDVTKQWIKKSKPLDNAVDRSNYIIYNNKKYILDNKHVKYKKKKYIIEEEKCAIWLMRTFGGQVKMLPEVEYPQNISAPDYIWKGERWDLKTPSGSGKRTIEDMLKRKERQAHNFIIDIKNINLPNNEIERQINKIFYSKSTSFIKRVIIKNNNKLICVLTRKRG